MRRRTIALVLVAGLAAGGLVAQEGESGLVTVHLADGSSVVLSGWSLSYEYLSWTKGTPQHLAQSQVRTARELWVDKDREAVLGSALELVYEQPKGSRAPNVKEMRLAAGGGKPSKLKPKPPHRDLLVPDGPKDLIVLPRSLDLSGSTLTGTQRTFCLVTYSSLVECATTPETQVLRVEFQ